MKKLIILTLIVALLFGNAVHGTVVVNETSRVDDEVERTVDFINGIRSVDLDVSATLKEMALNHSKYMYYNEAFSMIEDSEKVYYRGKYPWDRAVYYKYDKPYVYEFISRSVSNYKDGILDIINNPYSRSFVLDPLYSDIGMSEFNGYYTYTLGGKLRTAETIFVYPFNGQQDVPVNWTNRYHIDPYEGMTIDRTKVGLPLTFTLYSDTKKVVSTTVNSIYIRELNTKRRISTKIITPESDRNLTNHLVVLPLEPYKYNTTYEVHIDVSFNGINYTYDGTFKTASSLPALADVKYMTRGDAIKKIINLEDLRLTKLEPFSLKFKDVDINSELAIYVNTAYEYNIIKGISDSEFGPKLNITTEQAYAILVRAYEAQYGVIVPSEADKNLSQYTDRSSISSWALSTIYKAGRIGLIPDSTVYLNPDTYLSEVAFNEMLQRFADLLDQL